MCPARRCVDAPRSTRSSTIQPGYVPSWLAARPCPTSGARSGPTSASSWPRFVVTASPSRHADYTHRAHQALEAPSERIRAAEQFIADLSAELAEARRIRDELSGPTALTPGTFVPTWPIQEACATPGLQSSNHRERDHYKAPLAGSPAAGLRPVGDATGR